MKKVFILAILLLGCSHSRHLTKSVKTVSLDSTAKSSASVHAAVIDSSKSLIDVKNEESKRNRDISIIETKTEDSDPIVLTGVFKIDTAVGGGIKLTSNGITLTAKYDKATGLIKAEVNAKGRGKKTTYTRSINIKDASETKAKDSTATVNKAVTKVKDSTGANEAKLHAKTVDKHKEVTSKTKWPVLQLLGLAVALIAVVWVVAKRKSIVGWIKSKV